MSSKCYVARSSEIAARRLGEETMIMSGRNSSLFTLNEMATVIWEAADGSTALEEIVDSKICPEFDVEREVALRDAELLTEALVQHGILLSSDKPFQSSAPAREMK